uniref:Putative nuclease HARBI1 n=1 Tax=Xenopus tropicalis TaxID=8364 RepID=A0A803KC54_XENTR
MGFLLDLEEEHQVPEPSRVMRPCIFRERATLEGLTEDEVVRRYRLNRATISSLYELLEPSLQPLTRRSRAVPGMVKLLCSLHFLATGSFQRVGGVSQPSFSWCLGQVLDTIHSVSGNFISFPQNWNEWNAVKRQFYGVTGIPSVLGHILRNRQGYHSLNVQVVCDAHMNILSIVSGFPGSSHDAYILRQSTLYHSFETGQMPHGWLLGDAGYPCSRWLITPIHRPRTQAECAFNEAHVRARSVIERTFGVLKSRFRCLDKSEGSLMYSPSNVSNIVAACAVLQNLANRHGLPCDVADDLEDPIHPQDPVRGADARGNEVRGQIVNNYFSCKYLQSLIPYTRNTKQQKKKVYLQGTHFQKKWFEQVIPHLHTNRKNRKKDLQTT